MHTWGYLLQKARISGLSGKATRNRWPALSSFSSSVLNFASTSNDLGVSNRPLSRSRKNLVASAAGRLLLTWLKKVEVIACDRGDDYAPLLLGPTCTVHAAESMKEQAGCGGSGIWCRNCQGSSVVKRPSSVVRRPSPTLLKFTAMDGSESPSGLHVFDAACAGAAGSLALDANGTLTWTPLQVCMPVMHARGGPWTWPWMVNHGRAPSHTDTALTHAPWCSKK